MPETERLLLAIHDQTLAPLRKALRELEAQARKKAARLEELAQVKVHLRPAWSRAVMAGQPEPSAWVVAEREREQLEAQLAALPDALAAAQAELAAAEAESRAALEPEATARSERHSAAVLGAVRALIVASEAYKAHRADMLAVFGPQYPGRVPPELPGADRLALWETTLTPPPPPKPSGLIAGRRLPLPWPEMDPAHARRAELLAVDVTLSRYNEGEVFGLKPAQAALAERFGRWQRVNGGAP